MNKWASDVSRRDCGYYKINSGPYFLISLHYNKLLLAEVVAKSAIDGAVLEARECGALCDSVFRYRVLLQMLKFFAPLRAAIKNVDAQIICF